MANSHKFLEMYIHIHICDFLCARNTNKIHKSRSYFRFASELLSFFPENESRHGIQNYR